MIGGMDLRLIGVDDANILFVYSKHLAAGEGLVYNIDGERVEGFSSMLWMLLTAFGYFLTENPAPLFLALNIVLVGSAVGYAWQVIEVHHSGSGAGDSEGYSGFASLSSLVFLAWMASNPAYFIWAVTSLMETGLWAALLLTTTMLLLRMIGDAEIGRTRLAGFAILNILMLLTRPESMAWVLYFLTMLLIVFRWQGKSFGSLWPSWLAVAAACGAAITALIAFRLSYFGYPLPNTYYAKMTPDKLHDIKFGLIYLREFVATNWVVVIPILAALAIVGRYLTAVLATLINAESRLNRQELRRFFVASAALVGILLPVLMGGDIFGAFRFYQPIWPLLILTILLLPFPKSLQRNSATVSVATLSAALIVFTLTQGIRWTSLAEDRGRVGHLYELTHRGIVAGQYIQEIFGSTDSRDLPTIGASAAGGAKIEYPGQVIDTMGLNFTPMAHHDGDKKGVRGHASFNKAVFWKYSTDLLEPTLCPTNGEFVNATDDPGHWLFDIYQEMFIDADFIAQYRFAAIEAPQSGGWLCTYIKRDLLASLQDRPETNIKLID